MFKIIDYQDRLRRVMHVQTRLVPSDFDLHLYPLARDEVYVALVLFRELFPQSVPGKVRERDVLSRMVAPHLIIGASIGRAQVKAFILRGDIGSIFRRIGANAERHADESARSFSSIGAGFARQLDFDHAVLKFGLTQDDEPIYASNA